MDFPGTNKGVGDARVISASPPNLTLELPYSFAISNAAFESVLAAV
jgi:hypothetical protein